MEGKLGRYKADLERLIKKAKILSNDLAAVATGKKAKKGELELGQIFFSSYQQWYSEAHAVIRQILPARLYEFEQLYAGDEKRKRFDAGTYCIRDWMLGVRATTDLYGKRYFDDAGAVFMRYQTQVQILESTTVRFESTLFEIKQVLQADLFDS